jgi:XTP/dITP diphosphohydrolase
MLRLLAGLPLAKRGATFRTVALVVYPNGQEVAVSGACHGFIAEAEIHGGGFGYDPLFIPAEADGRTFSQMTDDDKHALSHRGRAFRSLAVVLSS